MLPQGPLDRSTPTPSPYPHAQQALEQIVRVKDSMLWAALGDVKTSEEAAAAAAAQQTEVSRMPARPADMSECARP
jgi:prolyl oligopeptidase PreP (S9A serine peptidase family)